ncbi:spermidine/putrescine ABC transporter substrate-binding protein [Nocardioides sp. TF02-7]|uniref:polyamine ABC transporter substrate-binding protein n=1 Tax=Nocardioides sp. TF02-7 TaxID=2917724 RepID=UPI001F06FE86|nr:spermidine/putrescine ABC transporter substrate-binding protein [Nocardioides sp. TF02-7]UMG94428.1 spermidine/putrescine ABC transporter substrate-binding protein [Nocardioides sp. TF02-7]
MIQPHQPARRSTLSRRGLLRGGGAVAFAGLSAAALKLPFFSIDGVAVEAAECVAPDVSESQRELIISNWTGYIDPRRAEDSTMSRFQDETGISVTYNVDVNDNAEFYAKVRNQLGACEPIDRDMIILTDWMAARMINLGWIQPLDRANVPNLHANLIPALRGVNWDPELDYHAPWQSGLTGIAYNAAEVGEVGSFEELLTRSDLKGRITLLSEMADTMGFMLKVVGADPEEFDDDDWANAMDRLRQVVADGQLRQFAGNNYLQQLSQGSIVACEAWSGDVIQAQFENPDLKFVAPEEGLALWSDNMMVPNQATHQANAEAWIDFYYRPDIAAKLAAWVNFICPVQGAREEMEAIDPSLVDNPLIFPDDDMLANTWDFMALSDEQQQRYEGEWADVTAG